MFHTLRWIALLPVSGVGAFPSASALPAQTELETRQVAEGLHVVRGGAAGNVLVSVGADGVVLVDARGQSGVATLHQAIRSLSSGPVRLVLHTHYHEDHIGGDTLFRDLGALSLAHRNVGAYALVDTTIDELDWHRAAADPRSLPSIQVAYAMTLALNGDSVDVIPFAEAHTGGDLAFYFRRADIIHTGDIVELGAYPFIDWWAGGSLDGTIDAVDRLLALTGPNTRFLPGHGEVADRSTVLAYRNMLVHVRAELESAIASDTEFEAILARGITAPYDATRGGERAARFFLGMLYLGMRP